MMGSKDFVSSVSFKLKIENNDFVSFNGQSITFRLSGKEVLSFQMTKTIIKARYYPQYKTESETQISKDNTPTNLPSKLQNFKQNFLSGKGFVVYR